MRRNLLSIAQVVALQSLLIITSCGNKSEKQAGPGAGGPQIPAATKVDAFIVTARTLSEKIEVPGTLLANESTEIHPETSGRITSLSFREGSYVGKGALLAKIYDGDLQAQLRKLEVQLKIAEKTEERQSQLLQVQGISQQDYDLSLLSVNNIKADIEIIKTSITKTAIYAPYSGKLGLRNISTGAFVTNQTAITNITQTGLLKLDFTVPEKYIDKIKSGQPVSFRVQGKDKVYNAKITATEVSVSETTRSLLVRSVFVNNNNELIPGTFANVTLSFDPNNNALMVPSESVLPQARGKKLIVYENGIANFKDVVTGTRDSAYVQISEGIKAGDTIVITGLLSVRPGGKLTLDKIRK